jgi:hypothetical protein
MPSPNVPLTLSREQVEDLNRKLSTMRHDINNHLSLVVAAIELIKYKPQMAEKMMVTLGEQPSKINDSIKKFSAEFEGVMGIKREKK